MHLVLLQPFFSPLQSINMNIDWATCGSDNQTHAHRIENNLMKNKIQWNQIHFKWELWRNTKQMCKDCYVPNSIIFDEFTADEPSAQHPAWVYSWCQWFHLMNDKPKCTNKTSSTLVQLSDRLLFGIFFFGWYFHKRQMVISCLRRSPFVSFSTRLHFVQVFRW